MSFVWLEHTYCKSLITMGCLRKRGENWCIDYRAYGQRYRECIGTSKKLAEEVLAKREVEIAEGKFLDKRKQVAIKFEDFAKDYIEIYAKQNKKSWETDEDRIKALSTKFSGRYLYSITPLMIEEYKGQRVKDVSASTVNRDLACLKHMFTIAIQWGKAQSNPVKQVKLYKVKNNRLRYLEKEEAQRLIDNCSGYLKNIVIIALNTGIRRGEILGLKWADIDFNRRIIYLLDTKNGDRREVPVNKTVMQALIDQRKHKDSPYVFYNNQGKPLGHVKKSFLAALKKSDIISFRFHDMRHTFASQLVMSGVDLNTVREKLGHKSMQMTLRYSHLSPAYKQRAVEVLDQKWSLDGHKQAESEIEEKAAVDNTLKISHL